MGMPSASGLKNQYKYVAVEQNEEFPTESCSEEYMDSPGKCVNSNVVYHEMNDLDSEGLQDASSTTGLGDLDSNVGFWPRSRKYAVRWSASRWLPPETKLSKREALLLGISVILVLFSAVILALFLQPENRVCTTRACIEVAGMVASSLDETVDPCQDFYKFSCGGWQKKNPLPAGRASWDVFHVQSHSIQAGLKTLLEEDIHNNTKDSAERKAKLLFKSCVNMTAINKQGAAPLQELIKKAGGWSLTGTWNESDFDLNKLIRKLLPMGATTFFSFGVETDLKNVNRNMLVVSQGHLSLNARKFYMNKTMDDKVLKAYNVYMAEVCELLGADYNTSFSAMQDVLLFEQKLANISMSREEARSAEDKFKHITIAALQNMTPIVDWMNFINASVGDALQNEELKDSEPVGTASFDYLEQVSSIVQSIPINTLNNYMIWHLVSVYEASLGQDFLDARTKVNKAIYGSDLSCIERWRTCVSTVDGSLGLALGKMFVENSFDEKSKIQAETMVTEIKDAFKRNLPGTSWIDDETRKKAIEKIDAVQNMIGFPDYILNQTRVDEEYFEFDFTEDDPYFDIIFRFYQFAKKKEYEDLREPVDKTDWEMTPPTMNAYYAPTKNIIAFPAGILQPPAYSGNYPQSVNFGGIGIVVGHELSHGFDDQGRKFDLNGNLVNWWKNETLKKFKKKTACMAKQYSKYMIDGSNVNGDLTLGENIADNGGLRLAYDAYMEWRRKGTNELDDPLLPSLDYTHEQLFFISYGQLWCSVVTPQLQKEEMFTSVHSPNPVRVIGAVSNSQEFAKVFNCKAGTPMNPVDKCRVW